MANKTTHPTTCQDCLHLDLSVHTAAREYAVGFCRKFCETQFKITTACTQFVHAELPDWDVVMLSRETDKAYKTTGITQTYLEL